MPKVVLKNCVIWLAQKKVKECCLMQSLEPNVQTHIQLIQQEENWNRHNVGLIILELMMVELVYKRLGTFFKRFFDVFSSFKDPFFA